MAAKMHGPDGDDIYCTKMDFRIFLLSICHLAHVDVDDYCDAITFVSETDSN